MDHTQPEPPEPDEYCYGVAGGVVTRSQYLEVLCRWREWRASNACSDLDIPSISKQTAVPRRQVRALLSIFHREALRQEWAQDRADRGKAGPSYHWWDHTGQPVPKERGETEPSRTLVNHRDEVGAVDWEQVRGFEVGLVGGVTVGVEP